MVTYVQNKLIKVTIIVDISNIGFNAHCMHPTRSQNAVHLHFELKTRCAFATSLRRFSQSGLELIFYIFLWVDCVRLCVTETNLGTTKTQRI